MSFRTIPKHRPNENVFSEQNFSLRQTAADRRRVFSFRTAHRVGPLTFAFREVVETVGTLVAQLAAKVLFARALAALVLALSVSGAFQETVARLAVRIPVITFAAPVAVGRGVRRFALALAETLRAVAGRVEHVAVARCERDQCTLVRRVTFGRRTRKTRRIWIDVTF